MMAEMETVWMRRPPRNILKLQSPPPPPATESGSEHPQGVGCIFSLPPRPNQYPTTSGGSYTTCPIYDQIWFKDRNLWPSYEASGSRSGWSLGSILGTVLICCWDIILLTTCT